jgi:DNA polymerase-3 subunit beta
MPDEKASISLGNLKHALQVTAQAKSKSANIVPILQCVRIEQIDAGLAVEATDLDVFIRVVLPEIAGPQNALITPAEKFHQWAKLLDGETVSITSDSKRATVKCGRAKAQLPLLPASNWPANTIYALKAEADDKGITLTQGALARALGFALIAVGEDNNKHNLALSGIQLSATGGKLHVASSNGYCLMLYTIPCDDKINLLLPGRLVRVLMPLLTDEDGGVDLAFSENQILANIDADRKMYVGSPRPTGRFPNYEPLIPKDKRVDVRLKVEELKTSLDRCTLLSDEKSGAIDLTFAGGELTVHAANALHGEADEVIPYTGTLEAEFKTRLNAAFLRDLARKLSGELTIAIPDSNDKAMYFKATPHEGEALSYVAMPMRLN